MSKPTAIASPAACRHHEWMESFLSSEPPPSRIMFPNTMLQAAAPTADSTCCRALHRCPPPGGAPHARGCRWWCGLAPASCPGDSPIRGVWGLTPPSLRTLAKADGRGHRRYQASPRTPLCCDKHPRAPVGPRGAWTSPGTTSSPSSFHCRSSRPRCGVPGSGSARRT